MDYEACLAVVENKVEYYENVLDKLDVAIDKMSEASSHISKMLAVHEEKLQYSAKNDDVILSTINLMKKDTNEKLELVKKFSEIELSEVNSKIEKIQSDVNELQKLKWIVNGIGIATSISVVAILGLFQGFLTPDIGPSIIKQPSVEQR